jgi:hypothetical protein
MPPKGASKKTAKGFAEILNAARAAGLAVAPPEPDAREGPRIRFLTAGRPLAWLVWR